MQIAWRCQKCFRYLAHIEVIFAGNEVTQRTICPRCKSENKITLNAYGVIASCAFSNKYTSNIPMPKKFEAVDTRTLLVEKVGKERCFQAKIIINN